MKAHKIILEIDRMLRSLDQRNDFWKRIRIAISPEEESDLKDFLYKYEIKRERAPIYYHRIRGVPIRVESDPMNDALIMESLR
jgi:hypothetical protein